MKQTAVHVVFTCLLALSGGAQTTSEISGRIADPGGSVVPGAQVQVTNLDTNAVKTAQSGNDGSYSFPALTVGPYKLEVRKDGFETYVQSGIVLQLNVNPTVNVALQLGSITQSVEVKADAAMVETQNTGVGQVIQPEQVLDLPLNDRQVTQLIALSGAAVSTTGSGGTINTLDYPTAVSFSVAGSQANETNYKLDGSPNMDYRTNVGAPLPFPDALQEFRVESNSLPANSGGRPGGTVGAVTKGGTNSFHGDLFEFLRNGIMDADSYQFGNTANVVSKGIQDTLKRNQFGGVVGGPVKKNKVFFFYGLQGTEERSHTNSTRSGIPTAATLAGDFTAFLAPPCQATQQYLNSTVASPISGGAAQQLTTAPKSNIILPQWLATPSAQISAKIAALLPTPIDACGDVLTVAHIIDREFQNVARVDWQHTANDALFIRYFITDYAQPDYYQPGNLINNTGPGLADRVQNVVIGDTHTISATMVNTATLNFGRTADVRTSVPQIPNLCTLGMNATCPLPNYLSYDFSAPGFLGYDYENVFGGTENLGWQIHSYHLEMGAVFQHVQMNNDGVFQVNPGPTVTTGSASYTGQGLADFITGMADGYGQGNGQVGREGENYPALYVQDNWKVAQRFQVNLGLRWDPFYPQHTGYGYAADFSLANYIAGKQSSQYVNAPPGITFPGDPGFNGKSDTVNRAEQFSPRIGMVWDPTGKGKMSVRAGYGLSYNTSVLWNTMHVVLNPPWGETLSFTPAPVNVSSSNPLNGGGVANPFYGYAGGNPFPSPGHPPSSFVFPVNGTYVFEEQNLSPSHTQSWNVSFQDQITRNWLASASYIGNKTNGIWLGQSQDPSTVISAGMAAPGIVSTAGMAGTSGPCTLLYGAQTVTFPTCNSASTVSVSGISNEKARGALNLANPTYGPLMAGGTTLETPVGYANYNGLLLSLQHRLSEGFSVLSNYTWSHCIDLGEVSQDIGNSFSQPNNPQADKGNCSQDRRQILNTSVVYQTPKLANAMLERVAGGWNLSGIFTAASGSPFNITDGSDISLTAVNLDRPTVVGNPFAAGPVTANPGCVAPTTLGTEAAWYNPCAFVKQASGTLGNDGRNNMFGPGRYNLDSALWRTFRIRERYKLDFRGEAFNVLNHAAWSNPASALNTGVPGKITSAANTARILQVAMKLTF